MDQNPIEQQKKRIEALKNEMRIKLGQLFDEKEKINSEFDKFISRLDSYERVGLKFDKEKIIQGVKSALKIENKQEFVNHLINTIEPIIKIRATRPMIFEEINREETINNSDSLKLSEVLYVQKYDLTSEENEIFIHLAPAKDFMTKEKRDDFIPEVIKGLKELAKLIKPYPNIKKVRASSWILANKRSLKKLESLGFISDGEISPEERLEHFSDEERPVAKAFIESEDFLARYGANN